MPSWRVPISSSASAMVSGFGHAATSAIAAKIVPQSIAIESHDMAGRGA